MENKCKYCQINKKQALYETKHSFIMEGGGFHHGHTKIIFKKHKEDITELTPKEHQNFMNDLLITAKVVKKIFKPDKMNYELLGNWVPHIHWHIYPRYKTDPDYAQPPILSWKIMGQKVTSPKIDLQPRLFTKKEKQKIKKELKKEF